MLALLILLTLAVLWSCRLPVLCVYHQCPSQQGVPTDPSRAGSSQVDLSLADSPFVSWPLARLCAEVPHWTPNLTFICDNNSGGIGNIRNFLLTCIRYAIAAGATGIIAPTIQTRSESRLDDLFRGEKVPLGYFFDESHFRESLEAACPQMKVWDDVDGVLGAERKKVEMITPNHFGQRGGCDQRDLNRHVDLFGARFRGKVLGSDVVTATSPKLIRFNWGVQWTYPVLRDGPEFVAAFGGLLRFRQDILDLGKKISALLRQAADGGGGFVYGMHLRTENDALSAWPSFEEQSAAYLGKTMMNNAGLAYLATGNSTEAARLKDLAGQDLQVVTKQELLGAGSGLLEQFSWDQQALVDFVVLLEVDYFLGVSPSSFSMNVALKRHLKEEGLYTRPWKVGVEEGDGRSWLVGKFDGYWDNWLFMYDSLWP